MPPIWEGTTILQCGYHNGHPVHLANGGLHAVDLPDGPGGDGGGVSAGVDLPAVEKDDAVVYSTLPLGIIVTDKHIITVCLKESSILKDMQDGLVRGAETQKRTSFIR